MHRLQLSWNVRDSPGFVAIVPDMALACIIVLFVPDVDQHIGMCTFYKGKLFVVTSNHNVGLLELHVALYISQLMTTT